MPLKRVVGKGAVEPMAELLRAEFSVPIVVKGHHVAHGVRGLLFARASARVKLSHLRLGDLSGSIFGAIHL